MAVPQTFEASLDLEEKSKDVYQNVCRPWTWSRFGGVPGSVLMSTAAAAAYRTVTSDFSLANLQAHFLTSPRPDVVIVYKVSSVSNGRRFAVRVVSAVQHDKPVGTVTLSFVNSKVQNVPAMTHSVTRVSSFTASKVERDDLGKTRTKFGPFMEFQRTPILPNISQAPENGKIAPVICRIISPISTPAGTMPHILGVVQLSDYHVLVAPLNLHGITFGMPEIGSAEEEEDPGNSKATPVHVKAFTSLYHSIHFHVHDGFRADELCYVEMTSPWARNGRAMIHSRIFSKAGLLIATCTQEGFYVLKEDAKSNIGSRL